MNNQLFWFTTRGAGIVSLILLSAVVLLGVLSQSRFASSSWPRFLTPALHRNLSLVAVIFLLIHIATAVVDPFTHLGIVAALVPFGSYYRTFYLGLGTLSVELMAAVITTSLLRPWVGGPGWKALHFLSYPLWAIAVVHGLGTGTDSGTLWLRGITVLCVALVTGVVVWRFLLSRPDPLHGERRQAAAVFRGGNS